ncbi:hypothetical protein BGW42_005998 [Actinomortierella wolfii]|nr:hypothetical protein BGW42_005998 [Actinomortierella wolfii]
MDHSSRLLNLEKHGNGKSNVKAAEIVLLSDEDDSHDPKDSKLVKRRKMSQDHHHLFGSSQTTPITVKYGAKSSKPPQTPKPSIQPQSPTTPPSSSRVRHLAPSTSPITPEKVSAMGAGTYPQAQLLGVLFNNDAGLHSPAMRLQFTPDRLVFIIDKVVTRIPHSELKVIEFYTASDINVLLIDTKGPLDPSSNLAPHYNPEPHSGKARQLAVFCKMDADQLTNLLKEIRLKGVAVKPLTSTRSTRRLGSSNTDAVLFTYPFSGGPKSITVHESDVARLEPDQFLNDTIIEFGLKYMQDELEKSNPDLAKQIYVFNTFFYERLSERDRIKKWTSKVDLFEKKYILVPIHESAHWYLAVITNPGLLLSREKEATPVDTPDTDTPKEPGSPASKDLPADSPLDSPEASTVEDKPAEKLPAYGTRSLTKPEVDPTAKPYIIVLDSLDLRHPAIFNNLRSYLQHELEAKKGITIKVTNASIVGKYAKWPRQGNHCDCGIFLLHYAKTFLMEPEKMLWSIVNSVNNENMWSDDEITKLRDRYKEDLQTTKIKYAEYQEDKQRMPSTTVNTDKGTMTTTSNTPSTSLSSAHSAIKHQSSSPASMSASPSATNSPSSVESHSRIHSDQTNQHHDGHESGEDIGLDPRLDKQPTPEELAAHRRQQQEYEEAVRKIQNLVDNVRHDPMKTHKITVHGTAKTREGFMHRALSPLFEAQSLHEVIGLSRQMVRKLERFGIFEDVKVQLDSPKEDFLKDRKDLVDVGFWVKEGSRVQIKTGTEAGNAEASAYGSLTVKNVFGGAETLNTSMAFGTRTSSAFQFSFATPLLADPDKNLSFNLFSQSRNNTQWSSHEEDLKGGSVKYSTFSPLGYHEFSYDGHWREITRPSENASMSIREQCGHSLKSSLTHMWIHDMRDEPLMPSTGHYFRLTQEYAGLGGDVNHLRHELETQVVRSNSKGYILSATVKSGYLHSLNGKPSKLSDRFFLGGPMSVRGFKSFGLGPRDGHDSLGGDAYVSAGVSLLTPFPGFPAPDSSVKGHLFANAGSLIAVAPGVKDPKKVVDDLTKAPSVSVGAGVVYRHPQVRIELNFALPLVATKTDALSRGWQLGLGISFL